MRSKKERLEYGKTLKLLMMHLIRLPDLKLRLKNKRLMDKAVVVQNLVLPSLCRR